MRKHIGARLLLCGVVLLMLGACKKATPSTTTPTDPRTAAVAYYTELKEGRYDRFAAGMQSLDGKPESYREQMVTLLKQHYVEESKTTGGIQSVAVQNVLYAEDGRSARVFLNVSYRNAPSEEIVTNMVLVGNRWRLM